MASAADQELILSLLRNSTFSKDQIAAEVGVTRNEVECIYYRWRKTRSLERRPTRRHIEDFRDRIATRCPECGHKVFMPCRGCDLKKRIAAGVPIEETRRPKQVGTPYYTPSPEEIERQIAILREQKRQQGEVMYEYERGFAGKASTVCYDGKGPDRKSLY
jgi:DNA-directed RNA polymerase subunit RPC12/RpoP